MSEKKPRPPVFKSEAEESEFWGTHDTEDFDLGPEIELEVIQNAKTMDVSFRIPVSDYKRIETEAAYFGVPIKAYFQIIIEKRARPLKFLDSERMKSVRFFATTRHCDRQIITDKHGTLPYTHHLQDVERVLARFGFFEEELFIAAWLHDVVEDTGTKLKEIQEMFGERVHDLVWAVTDEPGETRAAKKAATYPKTRSIEDAVALKLADRIANVEANGSMVKRYKKEYVDFKRALFTGGKYEDMWRHLDKLMK